MEQKNLFRAQDDDTRTHPSLRAFCMKGKRGENKARAPSKKSPQKSFIGKHIAHGLECVLGRRGSERELMWSGMEFPSSRSFGRGVGSRNKKRKEQGAATSPQVYLDEKLKSLGYSTRKYSTLESGYHAEPTALQTASYQPYVIRLAREGKNKDTLKEIVESGVSPNPCNRHEESLVHMVCGFCDSEILQILLDAGASVKISDHCGRTPLHYACSRKIPCFGIIEKIARQDLNLFYMEDCRGALPLSYVPREQWKQWVRFLECEKNLWQTLAGQQNSKEARLVDMPPNMFRIKDPQNALPLELAYMVAAGKISPDEAKMLHMDAELSDCTAESTSLPGELDDDISFSSGGECDFKRESYQNAMEFDPIGIGV